MSNRDEMTWEEAEAEWSGYTLADRTPDDTDELQTAYEAGLARAHSQCDQRIVAAEQRGYEAGWTAAVAFLR